MGLTARDSGGGDFSPAPEGTHLATCVAVIDLGTQYTEKWKKQQHRVLLGWELDTDEKRDDGAPFIVWKRHTVSLHKKAGLRRDLEAWRGRQFTDAELEGFDLKNILGKPCIIGITQVTREGTTYTNVASVAALPKRMEAPKATTKTILFDVDAPDMDVFNGFGDKLKEQIQASAEWKDRDGGGGNRGIDEPPPPTDDDPIPF